MDPTPLAGMVFTLLLVLGIGGFILLYPLSRRLGLLLENRLQEKRQGAAPDVAQLRDSVHALQDQVDALVERQEFLEGLLQAQRPSGLLGESERATGKPGG